MSNLALMNLRQPRRAWFAIALSLVLWIGFALVAISLGVILIGLITPDAFAQEATVQAVTAPASSWADSPLVGLALEISVALFGPLLVGMVLAVLGRLYGFLGLKQTAENRATVEQVLARALAFARLKEGIHPTIGLVPPQLERDVVQAAAAYAYNRAPKALAAVGVTSDLSANLETMLKSRLGGQEPAFEEVAATVAPRQTDAH